MPVRGPAFRAGTRYAAALQGPRSSPVATRTYPPGQRPGARCPKRRAGACVCCSVLRSRLSTARRIIAHWATSKSGATAPGSEDPLPHPQPCRKRSKTSVRRWAHSLRRIICCSRNKNAACGAVRGRTAGKGPLARRLGYAVGARGGSGCPGSCACHAPVLGFQPLFRCSRSYPLGGARLMLCAACRPPKKLTAFQSICDFFPSLRVTAAWVGQ